MKTLERIDDFSSLFAATALILVFFHDRTGNDSLLNISLGAFLILFGLNLYYIVNAYPLLKQKKIKTWGFVSNIISFLVSAAIIILYFIVK